MSTMSNRAILFVLLACAITAGCNSSENKGSGEASQGGASQPDTALLVADPNPVPLGTGKGGASTTLSWEKAECSYSQLYVSVDGGPEKLIVQGGKRTATVNWIYRKPTYEFRLYEGKDHKTIIAKVQVTRR